jgi:hypothetical protein
LHELRSGWLRKSAFTKQTIQCSHAPEFL